MWAELALYCWNMARVCSAGLAEESLAMGCLQRCLIVVGSSVGIEGRFHHHTPEERHSDGRRSSHSQSEGYGVLLNRGHWLGFGGASENCWRPVNLREGLLGLRRPVDLVSAIVPALPLQCHL